MSEDLFEPDVWLCCTRLARLRAQTALSPGAHVSQPFCKPVVVLARLLACWCYLGRRGKRCRALACAMRVRTGTAGERRFALAWPFLPARPPALVLKLHAVLFWRLTLSVACADFRGVGGRLAGIRAAMLSAQPPAPASEVAPLPLPGAQLSMVVRVAGERLPLPSRPACAASPAARASRGGTSRVWASVDYRRGSALHRGKASTAHAARARRSGVMRSDRCATKRSASCHVLEHACGHVCRLVTLHIGVASLCGQ